MKWIAHILLVLAGSISGCQSIETNKRQTWSVFGQPISATEFPPLSQIRASINQRVSGYGTIDEVCQTMGCWLTLRDPAGDIILVMTRDHAYFVPRNAAGRSVIVLGELKQELFTVAELRHLAEDAGKNAAEIDAITEPKTQEFILADRIWISGPNLDRPVRE